MPDTSKFIKIGMDVGFLPLISGSDSWPLEGKQALNDFVGAIVNECAQVATDEGSPAIASKIKSKLGF